MQQGSGLVIGFQGQFGGQFWQPYFDELAQRGFLGLVASESDVSAISSVGAFYNLNEGSNVAIFDVHCGISIRYIRERGYTVDFSFTSGKDVEHLGCHNLLNIRTGLDENERCETTRFDGGVENQPPEQLVAHIFDLIEIMNY